MKRNSTGYLRPFEDTDLKEFADILFNTVFTAYLKGRADVIEDVSKKQFAETTLEPFPFDEAVRFFKEKIPVPPEFFKELEAELKPKFFSISRVEVFDTITEIHSRLLSSLEEGKTFRDFKNEIDEIMLRTGRDPLNPFHLETVFKTNIQQAYGAGLWEQITDPETKHMIAYLRYSAILDERTRPSHAQMHGYTAPPDDPIWKTWFPPNGFNCRCTVETITKWEAEQYKIEPTRDITPPYLEGDFAIDPATAFRSWSEPEMMEILEELEIENENFPPICPSEEFAFDTIKGILKAIIRKKCRPINKIKNPHDLPELFPDVEQFTSLRDAQKYYTERLVESLGGEEKWVFTPIFPVKVEIRNFLKSIILKKDPKRSAYLPLFIKTLKEPNEIWFQTFRDKTGKRKWRLVYIAFFKKFGEKGYMSVIDLRRKGPFAWTAFPANFEYLGKIRGGRLIKTDKGYIRKVGWLIWEK
jgi:SPP1 gp7 family putative phage head morphogenesis protein